MTLKFAGVSGHTEVVMTKKHFAPLLMLAMLPAVVTAQAPKTQALLMAMGANSKQMAPYQWKQKTTVIRKGMPVGTFIEELRFDTSGQLQRITLSKPEEKKMGPLKARKAAEIKDDVQDVMRLAGRYVSPPQLSQAIQKGEVWEGQGTLRVQSRSLILPIDEMTMVVSGASYLPIRADFKTQYESSPVVIAVDYQQLPNGPNMMARMTVQIPKDDIVVNVESFDFLRLASQAGF
jgi:hypothetical protein